MYQHQQQQLQQQLNCANYYFNQLQANLSALQVNASEMNEVSVENTKTSTDEHYEPNNGDHDYDEGGCGDLQASQTFSFNHNSLYNEQLQRQQAYRQLVPRHSLFPPPPPPPPPPLPLPPPSAMLNKRTLSTNKSEKFKQFSLFFAWLCVKSVILISCHFCRLCRQTRERRRRQHQPAQSIHVAAEQRSRRRTNRRCCRWWRGGSQQQEESRNGRRQFQPIPSAKLHKQQQQQQRQ